MPDVRERGGTNALFQSGQRLAQVIASGTVSTGNIVKASGTPFKVSAAADGDSVFGVVATAAEADEKCVIIVEGEALVKTKSTASWTTHRRVCAAGSNEADQGSADDPFFATLIEHYSSSNLARVYVHGDSFPRAARSLVDSSDVSWPLGALTAGRPLVLGTTSRVASPLHIGTTGNRPASPYTGQTYFDSDISEAIVYDGTRWRSATPHQFSCGRVNGSAASSNGMFFNASNAMTDAAGPFIVDLAARVMRVSWGMATGTGGIDWTLRLRLNGSGSDSWASSARTSSTSWQYWNETIDLALSAGDRLRWLADTGGSTETQRVMVLTSFVYT